MKLPVERRPVDAPEVSRPLPLKCFEDDASRYAARHSGLDNLPRLKVDGEAPDCSREGWIGVVPAAKCASTDREVLRLQELHRGGVDGFEARAREAGPRNAHERVKVPLPRALRLDGIGSRIASPDEAKHRAIERLHRVLECEPGGASVPDKTAEYRGWSADAHGLVGLAAGRV